MMSEERSDVLVLFGATGDLAHKKIFPALYAMVARGTLKEPVVGVALEDWDAKKLAERARDGIKAAVGKVDEKMLSTFAALLRHDWPGNVRELRTAAERFAIGLETPAERLASASTEGAEAWLPAQVAAYERELIAAAIREHQGDMAGAAQSLGIPRRTLNEKMNRLGLTRRAAEPARR